MVFLQSSEKKKTAHRCAKWVSPSCFNPAIQKASFSARWFPSSESRSVGAHITPISLWFIVDMVYKNWVNNCTYYNYTIYGL